MGCDGMCSVVTVVLVLSVLRGVYLRLVKSTGL